ncbi:uncharacterized protein C8orf58 homolog isoform X2 [Hemicordylus capensis]|uniref:uncharacterized protein C8orf58 homolog isoform X2 n=1 Tax=Hemicordylus capensis TaxID=884348 RepID=UPI002304A25C|nr:uncharacterized protein C8orf58 homolog isoform X2 [Hemicordylus capensis]
MLGRRRIFSVEPIWNRDRAWKSVESSVVLTSVTMYRKLQDPPPECALDRELAGKMDRWAEAESPTEPPAHKALPHTLDFLPTSGRLLKSESEDSGVEMASSDHSPSTPVGSEKSFSLDFLDGFQPSTEDPPPSPPPLPPHPMPHESCPKEEGLEEPGPVQDRAYHRNLSISKKLAQVVQRSQKNRAGRISRPLGQRARSLVDSEGFKSDCLHHSVNVDGEVDAAAAAPLGGCWALSGCSTPEEQSTEEEAQDGHSLTMPGQGLRYLEHICQMLEKIAQLQQANLRLQHQHRVMECQIRAQESGNEGLSQESPVGPEPAMAEPQLRDPEAMEMEKEEEEEDPNPLGSWSSHHFRARSASDTGNKLDCSRKAAAHSASEPNLLDQPDGGSRTLPSGMKLKNDHSHWGKVKVLINRITRRSVQAGELSPFDEPSPSSRQCRADTTVVVQEQPRRRFLPTLRAKKRRSKHLSMR